MEWISQPEAWIALGTLTLLEIVLGIDNIVIISLLTSKLPGERQRSARIVGLGLALFVRVALLFSLTWLMGLTAPIFALLGREISGRDLILILGGVFLVYKSTHEIHDKLEGEEGHESAASSKPVSFSSVIIQIILMDIVFSLDSVITAIGMARHIMVMVIAVVIAILIMMASVGTIADFIHRHPTVQMLAFSFLLLIGVTLVADGLGEHIPKGYIYSAMAFSVFVEALNLRTTRRSKPVELHHPTAERALERAEHQQEGG
ncbi:MAG TPA: TerC family protein [Rhodothermales bacterium]|nr:TerC family protein [Rhodothermales bacterium]